MEKLVPRSFVPPRGSFFLFGPRGTGKSTWLREHYPDALRIDLLQPDMVRRYSAYPERLVDTVRAHRGAGVVILDEVQKVPELLDVVHAIIEEHTGVQFVLTGSSARKLRNTGVDLLAGRALRTTFHPFLAAELGDLFVLEDALRFGCVPLVFSADDRERAISAYVSVYLHEEVRIEGLTRNIGNFGRFLEAVSFSHGSILNTSNVARECEVGRKTVEGYIGILEDLLVAYRVPVFSKRAKREVVSHQKFYFFDSGVYGAIRPKGPLDRPEEIHGAALEGLVAQHLIGYNAYRGEKNTLYYWRTRAGTEVDFILYGEEAFFAVEVKHTARLNDADLSSLRSFHADYPESKAICVYRGKEKMLRHGILCIPCDDFLRALDPASAPEQVYARLLQ